jgi:hypothetical protein
MSRSDDAASRLRRDAEAFYTWAVIQIAREKLARWDQPQFRSPYHYGKTRTP